MTIDAAAHAQLGTLGGIRIVENALALEQTREPKRRHRRRRWMSARYHERIQKKWIKRWGHEMKPCMWKVSPRAMGMPGQDYFVVHPALMTQVRQALAQR